MHAPPLQPTPSPQLRPHPLQLPSFQEGWLGAEAWDASRQLEAAVEAYTAWQPAAEQLRVLAAAGGEDEDMAPETPRSRCVVCGMIFVWAAT